MYLKRLHAIAHFFMIIYKIAEAPGGNENIFPVVLLLCKETGGAGFGVIRQGYICHIIWKSTKKGNCT